MWSQKKKRIQTSMMVGLVMMLGRWTNASIFAQSMTSNPEYLPNYEFVSSWENVIMESFSKINGLRRTGGTPDTGLFDTLGVHFRRVFPKLPQLNKYKIVYDICLTQSDKLAAQYSLFEFDLFVDQCMNPLLSIIQEVNNNYTIKASASASPNGGAAPITVTFDGRASQDPSNDTIPTNNFFWYYKDTKGKDVFIGRGSVISHTFESEGTYHVHMTVRSANKDTKGILDGATTQIVNVSPEIANLVVYANNKKLHEKVYTKIGTSEARNGIVLDASATLPKGGREIKHHTWEISGPNGYKLPALPIEGKPNALTQKFEENGAYIIKLSVTDNENNTITKQFLLTVSDPIALIRQSPENITTTTKVQFDGGASYAINSRIKRYHWDVYNEQGTKIYTSQSKSINQQFTKPGSYTVKLTVTDDLNETNSETKVVIVESTPPQAQFTITPRLDWEFPSQFVLDATSSFDVDALAGFDALKYERTFSNPKLTKIEQTYDNGESIVVSFEQPGKHKVILNVMDSYGQTSSFTRDIDVKSSLRPILYANPRANAWGSTTRFMVSSNADVLHYEWDFGDGTKEMKTDSYATHTYKKSGVYKIILKAIDKKGNHNTISTFVFVGNKDMPIGAYTVQNARQNILRAEQQCNGNNAYEINRGESISINASESVNVNGTKNGLQFYFTPEDAEIFKSSGIFTYKFDALGCKKVNILVEDTAAGKTDQQEVWFKVVNDLPKLDSLSMHFPQLGNEVGIGLNQASQSQIFDPLKINPLIIKITANSAKDTDGSISQFIWYYYKADDPTRILHMESTTAHVPYNFFSIDTHDPLLGGGNIVFGVKIIDNDNGEIMSEELIGQGPSFFLPSCTTSGLCDQDMDRPIVTFSVDKQEISVGDEISFTVQARTLSNRPDFASQRVIRYDFDGDGKWDKVSKELTAKHQYTKAYEQITPRVEVTYRKKTVAVNGPAIVVKQNLKVRLEPAVQDKTVYLRDYSLGEIFKKEVCFGVTKDCTILSGQDIASFTYDSYGEKTIRYTIEDNFGNRASGIINVTLTQPEQQLPIDLISIPRSHINDEGRYVIPLANNQNNKVFIHVPYIGTGKVCYIDLDIANDSNYDGKLDNDKDLSCNTPRLVSLDPYSEEVIGRIIYEDGEKTVANGIVFHFVDQVVTLTPGQQTNYNKIIALIRTLPSVNDDQVYIKQLLQQMADNVKLNKNQTETIINLRVYLETTTAGFSEEQLANINNLIKDFETSDTIALEGGSIVDQVRQFLIDMAPSDEMKTSIKESFIVIQDLESPSTQPEIVKNQLSAVLQVFIDNSVSVAESQQPGNEYKIIEDDIETQILPRICEVLSFYEIPSAQCSDTPPTSSFTETTTGEANVMGTVLKWVIIVVGSLGAIFLGIVVFFAIKARLQKQEEEA